LLLLALVIESKVSGLRVQKKNTQPAYAEGYGAAGAHLSAVASAKAELPNQKGEEIRGMRRSLRGVSSAQEFRERLHRFNMGAKNLESGQDWNS
jgi:hypothetical protein